MTFDTDLVLKYLQIVECNSKECLLGEVRSDVLLNFFSICMTAITSLIIRTICLVN